MKGASAHSSTSLSDSSGTSAAVPEKLLETKRLYLRRFTEHDGHLLFELDSDPEVMRYITQGRTTPRSQIEDEILPRVLSYYLRPSPQGIWAAHLLENHVFIGWFHLRADKLEPEEMELGYRLKRSAWNCGFATEGSQALLHQGFCVWNQEKICGRTLRINTASRRVMEKLGMEFEREFYYPEHMLPGTRPEDRHAAKYSITSVQFLSLSKSA